MAGFTSINTCAACGEDHIGLLELPLSQPETVKGLFCTRYFTCPVKGIVVYISDDRLVELVNGSS